MCPKHYSRMRRNGTTETILTPPGAQFEWLMNFLEAGNFPEDRCVNWPFKLSSKGYAQFRHDNQRMYGHQVACKFYHGEKPPGNILVRHTCHKGHEGCVNPKHLEWGTYSENTYDYLADTGATMGEKSGMSKLTEKQVLEIVERLRNGEEQKYIANEYGVNQTTLSCIWTGKTWWRVTGIPKYKKGGD